MVIAKWYGGSQVVWCGGATCRGVGQTRVQWCGSIQKTMEPGGAIESENQGARDPDDRKTRWNQVGSGGTRWNQVDPEEQKC